MRNRGSLFLSKPEVETGMVLRGRYFTPQDLLLVSRIVEENYEHGRTRASIEICKALDWFQPNGWLKDRACRDVLLTLGKNGFLILPPRKSAVSNKRKRVKKKCFNELIDTSPITKIDFSSIKFQQVKGTQKEPMWNWAMNSYHYLGFRVFVGRALKYLVYSNDIIISAIGWCDPAWKLTLRDNLFHSLGIDIEEIRLKGINNGRFLIMPWVRVRNLASYLLSLATKVVQEEWSLYYQVKPIFLETFVDPERFSGTCYEAANWIFLGRTRGYRKCGQVYLNNQRPKLMFLYPLDKHLRTEIITNPGRSEHGIPK